MIIARYVLCRRCEPQGGLEWATRQKKVLQIPDKIVGFTQKLFFLPLLLSLT
jgi:hypothetical protein